MADILKLPPTREWLEEVGLNRDLDLGGGFKIRFWATQGVSLEYENGSPHSYDHVYADTHFAMPDTRDEVAALARLLGHPIKED